jgi:lactate dehydrogenase-like 2-hydroxyacid dehydrogenase
MDRKPTVFVSRKLPDAVEARLRRDYDARLNLDDRTYAVDELIAACEGADAVVTSSADKWTAEVIGRVPESVRIIATVSVGHEHIDLEAARRRGIVVTNTPEVLDDATADTAMLLMLGAARRAFEGERMMREGTWSGFGLTSFLGRQVSGKRLGIFGMGRIGRAVAQRARGFGMEIHYHNRRRLAPDLEQGAIYHDSGEALLPHCDFLSLHCPALPETYHFLNAERIALLPDGAVVVNTSRGTVVDDEALIAALRSGKVYAAGLDVYEGEPNVHPAYRTLPNTFLLPHLGSATVETRDAMGFRAVDNVDAFFAGRTPPDALT